MNFKKVISVLLIMVMLFVFMSLSFATASESGTTVINFSTTPDGNKFIYSNNPEYIYGTSGYTISQSLDTSSNYDAEFYHINSSGTTLRFGVLIVNNNTGSASVRVFNNNSAWNYSGNVPNATASMVYNYVNASSGYTDYSIAGKGSKFICFTSAASGYHAAGKVLFKALNSNMYCKVVYIVAGSNETTNQTNAQNAPETTKLANPTSTNCYPYDARVSTVSGTSGTKFYLSYVSGSAPSNPNEYLAPISYPNPSRSLLQGNYGVTYNLTLTGASGKMLTIKPDWNSCTKDQCYVFHNGISWNTVTIPYNSTGYTFTLPSTGGNVNIKFILPGGNVGNVLFKIS
ncbi:MAG: hypothetical protein N3I35_10855 [Clostridia bacterium]|nr:hypothetical protein [Clostridia bacterium]